VNGGVRSLGNAYVTERAPPSIAVLRIRGAFTPSSHTLPWHHHYLSTNIFIQ
jgi:hypothetical protein